jgi:hypothetical protein
MALSAKAVRVFATVEVLRDSQADVRHALATLFEPDLAAFNGELFDPAKLATLINREYRLGLTADVIAGFVEIFKERGWLKQVLANERSAFVVDCGLDASVPQDQSRFQSQAAEVAGEFREFISAISPLSQVKRSDEELIDDLVDWLMQLDRASEGEMRAVAASYKVGKRMFLDLSDPIESNAPSEAAFLSARFIDHLFRTKSKHTTFLVELGEVGLITEVVRDFQKPTAAVKKTDLLIYLDAPLAMDFLGLSGSAQQENIASILSGVTALGGKIRIFRQSVQEMQAALSAVLARPVADRTGPTAEALRRREVLEAYVRQVASNPDRALEIAKITILDQSLEAFPNEHKYFSREAVDLLYAQIGWVREDAARFHDASIAALAMRKRTGRTSSDLFETKHVVVTRNPTFPSLARRIAREFNYIGPNHVGPLIHQRQLATALWLRVGARTDQEIPRRYILSACRRVLTLRKNIVEKVHQLKSNLSEQQASQLELLLSENRSTQVLMDKTMGSAALIDSSNIGLLLEEMRKAQIEEHTKQSNAKLKETEVAFKERVQTLNAQLNNTNASLRSNEQIIADQRRKYWAVLNKAIETANRIITRRRNIVSIFVFIAFLVMSGASFFGNVDSPSLSLVFFLISVALGFLFLKGEQIRARFFNRLLSSLDQRTFTSTVENYGLDLEEVEPLVAYDGVKFKLASSDSYLLVSDISEKIPRSPSHEPSGLPFAED